MSIAALQARGLTPDDGPVVVTGASGGVGRMAGRDARPNGMEVWAVTGKPDENERLTALGAAGVLDRSVYEAAPGKVFEHERWAAAIDTVGAASLPFVLRTPSGAAPSRRAENTSGADLVTTVFPFILRGVSLLGIDSAKFDIVRRRDI